MVGEALFAGLFVGLAGLVFAAWSFGLAAIGTLLICKRDVSE